MRSVKSRNWSNQEDQKLLTIMDDINKNQKKYKWNEIADLLKNQMPDSNKNGKQCRERWTNQLNPNVKRTEGWTKVQNQIMFTLHNKIGNKWAEISSNLPGRTDNCVKNHFYSVIRGGLRKINAYIENIKRKQILVKTFKNDILNKILTICQGKSNQKFQMTPSAIELAHQVKQNLVLISLSEQDSVEDFNLRQKAYNQICQFARNCRRRKTKRTSNSQYEFDESQQQQQEKRKLKEKKKQILKNQQISVEIVQPLYVEPLKSSNKTIETIQVFNAGGSTKVEKDVEKVQSSLGLIESSMLSMKIEDPPNLTKRSSSLGQNLINSNYLGEFSFKIPQSKNSIFSADPTNFQGNDNWARNSGIMQMNNGITFLSTVPQVKKNFTQIENKRGELNFMDNFIVAAELFPIFLNQSSGTVFTNPQSKSIDMFDKNSARSGSVPNLSGPIENSAELAKLGIDANLQALISSSSFPNQNLPLTFQSSSSMFSLLNSYGKQSQDYKNRSGIIKTQSEFLLNIQKIAKKQSF